MLLVFLVVAMVTIYVSVFLSQISQFLLQLINNFRIKDSLALSHTSSPPNTHRPSPDLNLKIEFYFLNFRNCHIVLRSIGHWVCDVGRLDRQAT